MSTEKTDIFDLLERLCNVVRAEFRAVCNAYGLSPVQLEALGFLAQCNRYSDTPQAVADFLDLTKGTVSQTLKVLETKGLLRKHSDSSDKRLVHLKPTNNGRQLVEGVAPAQSLSQGLERLSKSERRVIVESLLALLRSVQKANNDKIFAP